MKRAAHCNECKHYNGDRDRPCNLDHRPRFYLPQTMRAVHTGDFGWKRRCADFKDAKEQQ